MVFNARKKNAHTFRGIHPPAQNLRSWVLEVIYLSRRPPTQDLSLIPVTTLEEVLEIISLGLKVRATHETKMNQVN